MITQQHHSKKVAGALKNWLDNGAALRNEWFRIPPLSVYVRKTPYRWHELYYHGALVVGNVSVEESRQNWGYFGSLLHYLENLKNATFNDNAIGRQRIGCIVFENVFGPKLISILQNRPGWNEYYPPGTTSLQFVHPVIQEG